MQDLYFHFVLLLAFVLVLDLGFGEGLSWLHLLVVDMAHGHVLYSLCTRSSEVSQCLSWKNTKET